MGDGPGVKERLVGECMERMEEQKRAKAPTPATPPTPTPPTCQEKCVEQFNAKGDGYVEDMCAIYCTKEANDQRNFEEAKSLRATRGAIPIVRKHRTEKPRLECRKGAKECEDFKVNHFDPIDDECEAEFDFVQGFHESDVGDCMDAELLPLEKKHQEVKKQCEDTYEFMDDWFDRVPEDDVLQRRLVGGCMDEKLYGKHVDALAMF